MRVVVDIQGLHDQETLTEFKDLDIKFFKKLIQINKKLQIILVLPATNEKSVFIIRQEFKNLMPESNIVVCHLPELDKAESNYESVRAKCARLIYREFILSLNPDFLHVVISRKQLLNKDSDFVCKAESIPDTTKLTMSLHLDATLDELSLQCIDEKILVRINSSKALIVVGASLCKFFQNFIEPGLPIFALQHVDEVDCCAAETMSLWEKYSKDDVKNPSPPIKNAYKLALVSPLPPSPTGIADYSDVVACALKSYYDITLVTEQDISEVYLSGYSLPIKNQDWFIQNHEKFDRVVYQVGNSKFHDYMLPLIKKVPGVVVLHDFYLYDLIAARQHFSRDQSFLPRELYNNHGYRAVIDYYQRPAEARWSYPVNQSIISASRRVIVHSEYCLALAKKWIGNFEATEWSKINLPRKPPELKSKEEACEILNIPKESFVICSFGHLGETKLNHRLLQAWHKSKLGISDGSILIFVGDLQPSDYQKQILDYIKANGLTDRVRITGYVESDDYIFYQNAADVAVQLRCNSRGETSAAALDCMAAGLPLIVNSNGSLAELDKNAVTLLKDNFDDNELSKALDKMWLDTSLRDKKGQKAKEIIISNFSPEKSALDYFNIIEDAYKQNLPTCETVISKITRLLHTDIDYGFLSQISYGLDLNFPAKRSQKTIYIDVSVTAQDDFKTGIQRVVRSIVIALLGCYSSDLRIEPVTLLENGKHWKYITAPEFTQSLFGINASELVPEVIEPMQGDVVLVLDLTGRYLIVAEEAGFYRQLRARGVKVIATVYDLLPVLMPEYFPPYTEDEFKTWLTSISRFDGAVCISKSVADELKTVLYESDFVSDDVSEHFSIDSWHLGADIDNSAPTTGLPSDVETVLDIMQSKVSFLMIGTIEPRKGHLQVIGAFEKLWALGFDVNLIIVGKEGWKQLENVNRRCIPEITRSIKSSTNYETRLFWHEEASDEFLKEIYANCACLIAASHGEGFGLPLIEAAQYRIPIIARDIPVFREVADEHALYFDGKSTEDLVVAIKQWLKLYEQGKHPKSDNMPWLTWKESA